EASQVKGTGRDGRITKEDAEQASVPAMGSVFATNGSRSSKTTKLSSLRRKLAQRLVSVKNETAMLTTFNEVDMSEIFRIRKQYKEEFA
ncbi:2-oxo acid dehydrogenase subunit E2, partial [Salmonella enterica]|nr:2-oxo acid dehydrogenase subunit E2 [Salmonella enterica]